MCEEKQNAEMLRLDGGFWEGGMTAVEKGVAIPSREEAEQEELEWEKEVESTLKSLSTVEAPEGCVWRRDRTSILSLRPTVPRQTTRSTYLNCQSYSAVQTSYWRVSRLASKMARLTHLLQSELPPPTHTHLQTFHGVDVFSPGFQL